MHLSGSVIFIQLFSAGLKSLILMGVSEITDVGVHFGFQFPELQNACLPYNKNVGEQ